MRNHLDLDAIEQLEDVLDGHDGTLLVVTHDRLLLQSIDVTRAISASGEEIDLELE